MRVAFKEWAVAVDALGAGDQILILRKGGISEGRRGFQVDHAEFFLYPTWAHQNSASVRPSVRPRLAELLTSADPNRVHLEVFAHVVSWRRLESMAAVERLQGQHIWAEEELAARFEWGKEKNIYALAVRVFRLATPVILPVLPEFGGCKSWIELEEDVDVEGATPVLSKEAFNEKLNQFHAALDVDGATAPDAAPG
jgi:hypothetical protein